jgi:transcriptional regulator with XRE-family HTH domain
MDDFGRRLRTERLRRDMSQSELAGDGISPSYVSLLESGQRTPSPRTVDLLTERLGCPLEALTGRTSTATPGLDQDLAYAELAIRHGEALSARRRLMPWLGSPLLLPEERDRLDQLLALAHERLGDMDSAIALLTPLFHRRQSALSRQDDRARSLQLEIALALCRCHLDAGDADQAVSVGEHALQIAERAGLTGTEAHLRLASTVVAAYFELGQYCHASAWVAGLIALAESSEDRGGRAALYWNAALVCEAKGRQEEALELCERALALLSEDGGSRDLARLQLTAAGMLLRMSPGNTRRALAVLEAALPGLQDLGSAVDLGSWENERGLVELLSGRPGDGEVLIRSALRRLSGRPLLETARSFLILGDCVRARRRTEDVEDSAAGSAEYLKAQEVLARLPGNRRSAGMWRALAKRWEICGQMRLAGQAYASALDAAGIRPTRHTTAPAVDQSAAPGTVTQDELRDARGANGTVVPTMTAQSASE